MDKTSSKLSRSEHCLVCGNTNSFAYSTIPWWYFISHLRMILMNRGRSLCSWSSAFKSLRRYLKKIFALNVHQDPLEVHGGLVVSMTVILSLSHISRWRDSLQWAPMQIPQHIQVYNTSIRTVLKCSESNWSISSLFTTVFINRIHWRYEWNKFIGMHRNPPLGLNISLTTSGPGQCWDSKLVVSRGDRCISYTNWTF